MLTLYIYVEYKVRFHFSNNCDSKQKMIRRIDSEEGSIEIEMIKSGSINQSSGKSLTYPNYLITSEQYHNSQKSPTICPYKLMKAGTEYEKSRITYLIPVHYTFTINNINYIHVQDAHAEVNAILTLAISYKDFDHLRGPNFIQILKQRIIVQLSNKQDLNLNSQNKFVEIIDNVEKKFLIFVIQKDFQGLLCQESVWWTPLESLYIIFSIQLQNIESESLSQQQKIPLKQTKLKKVMTTKEKKSEEHSHIKHGGLKRGRTEDRNIRLENEGQQMVDSIKSPSFSIKFNLLNFNKNRDENTGDMGPEIFIQKDDLNIGEYEICTVKSISQVTMYRIPYKIAQIMNLGMVQRMTLTEYKNMTDSNQNSNPISNLISQANSPGKGKCLFDQNNQEYSQDQLQQFYYEQLMEQSSMLKTIPKESTKDYNIKSFRIGHISINVFRHPIVAIVSLIFPLMTISLINLGVFWIDVGKDTESIKRVTVIVTSLVAYIGMIPVVRSKIPPTDQITLIEALVLADLMPCVLAMIELLRYSTTEETTKGVITAEFIIACVITLFVLLVCVCIVLYFYCCMLKNYRQEFDNEVNPAQDEFICDSKLWGNSNCQRYLLQLRWIFKCKEEQRLQQNQKKLLSNNSIDHKLR